MVVPLLSDSKRMYLEQIKLAMMAEYFRDTLEDITGSQLSKIGDTKQEDSVRGDNGSHKMEGFRKIDV